RHGPGRRARFGRGRPRVAGHRAGKGWLRSQRLTPGGGEALQVVLGVAEGLADHGEPAEGVAHLELLAHAHAAVELHRLLTDVTAAVAHLDLGGGDKAPAL